ncbi:MAG TPA: NrfD/PsrC family molybdoenzyme membrane anchor subunit [Vicinamibacterales bacterium]
MTDFERRLEELRRTAAETGHVDGHGVHAIGSPMPARRDGVLAEYYGQPLLKRPVWTWEVPAYFFVGGAAGAASVIGAIANMMGGRPDLVRDARWVAAAGAAMSPPLLIADLGRPERFLNMMRVFKLQSPMSVGVWTLLAFSNAAGAAAVAEFIDRKSGGRIPVRVIGNAAEVMSAATGLVLSTYTGVLIGATTIPVWSHNVRLLPIHFGASGVGTAVSVLELMGHRDNALNALGIGAAAVETAIGFSLELREDPALDPLKHGWSGTVTRMGGVLSGPVPLALRVLGARSVHARRAAAVSTIVGSLLTRMGWLAAGRGE